MALSPFGRLAAVLPRRSQRLSTASGRLSSWAQLLSTVIVLSLDRPLSATAAGEVAASFAGGALWAAVLTLVIWRLHPYRATRQAVAEIYHALAAMTADLLTLLKPGAFDSAGSVA